jgi:hypothetical protein
MEVSKMADVFMNATRKKYRFSTAKGNLTTEQLWDLPLESLDEIWQKINATIEDASRTSLLSVRSNKNIELTEKAEVVKAIVEYKLAAAEKADKARQTKAEKERILNIIAAKQEQELASMSIDELKKRLEAL